MLGRVKKDLRLTRYFTYMFISVWKIISFFICSLIILHARGENVGHLFTMFGSAFGNHKITVQGIRPTASGTITDLAEILPNGETETVFADVSTPFYALLVQIFGAYTAYVFGKTPPHSHCMQI